jgi:hypothetical protein
MRVRRTLSGLFLAVLLTAVFPVCGFAGVSVQLLLDKSEATVQDTITLRLRVSGAGSLASKPRIQGLQNFTVAAGGTSSHIEIINFSRNEYIEYLYYIQARSKGTFQIGPAEVSDGAKAYRSNAVTLTIRDVPKPQDQGQAEGPLFLKAALSKASVYVDEPVIYTVRLYRLLKVSNLSLEIPDVSGLAFKKIGEPIEYQSVVGGQPYDVLELRYEVVPAHRGRYRIPPATMVMAVYGSDGRRSGFPFGDPFFSMPRPRPRSVSSNPLELSVSPLPAEGRPANFSSLVGSYTMSSQLDKDTVAAGDTASLSVTIEGRGNVNRIPDLSLPDIAGIKTYADQPDLKTEADEQGYKGTKTMKWAFVPQKEGTYVIPSLSLTYFDTRAKYYRTIRTPAHALKVLPGASAQAGQTSAGIQPQPAPQGKLKREVVEVGRDILPGYTGLGDLHAGLQAMPAPAVFWALMLLPPLLCLGIYSGRKLVNPSGAYEEHIRAKGALKRFLKQCPSRDAAAETLLDACREYFNSRFRVTLGTLTPEEAAAILENHGVDGSSRDRCKSMLTELTGRIYTGQGDRPFDRYDELVSVIREIDRQGR